MAATPTVEPRALTANERAGLDKSLSSAAFAGIDTLRAQVPLVSVVGGLPTALDLSVNRSVPPAPVADGPVTGRWVVETANGDLLGELVVWVRQGYLDGFELAWLTDEPPTAFPPPERIRAVPEDADRDRLLTEARARVERDTALTGADEPVADSTPDEPGWVTDPSGRHQVRYWDGDEWTEYVADDGVQSEDPPDDPDGPAD